MGFQSNLVPWVSSYNSLEYVASFTPSFFTAQSEKPDIINFDVLCLLFRDKSSGSWTGWGLIWKRWLWKAWCPGFLAIAECHQLFRVIVLSLQANQNRAKTPWIVSLAHKVTCNHGNLGKQCNQGNLCCQLSLAISVHKYMTSCCEAFILHDATHSCAIFTRHLTKKRHPETTRLSSKCLLFLVCQLSVDEGNSAVRETIADVSSASPSSEQMPLFLVFLFRAGIWRKQTSRTSSHWCINMASISIFVGTPTTTNASIQVKRTPSKGQCVVCSVELWPTNWPPSLSCNDCV